MEPRRHQYPGVDLPLRHLGEDDAPRVGLYERIEESESELLHVREVAMMLLMDRLTDKPNWHEKVFDDAIVAKWRTEALTQSEEAVYKEIIGGEDVPMPKRTRIISEEAFGYVCELPLPCRFPADSRSRFLVHRRAEMQGRLLQRDWPGLHHQFSRPPTAS